MCDDEVALSASRHKVKWSQDPRNVHWASDTSKFGFRMLQKMGWAEGKGLGANEDGMKEHVKVSLKKDNLGVGATKCQSDEWITQRESFESLLANLNGSSNNTNDTEGAVKDLTVTANRSRKLTYRKMLKSKNLSMKSAEDMNCVLGKRKRDKDDNDQVVEKKSFQDDSGVPTVKSSISLNEYFSLRKKEVTKQKTDSDQDDLSKKKHRKKKKKTKST